MATSEVDNDTLAAVRAAWRQDTSELPTLVQDPPTAGRLKGNRPDYPYAAIDCQQGPVPNERMTGGIRHDFRQVTITIWGSKAQVAAAMNALLDRFNVYTTLHYPSGSRFIQWWPLSDGDLVEDTDTALGLDIWKGTLKAKVWSVRTDGADTAIQAPGTIVLPGSGGSGSVTSVGLSMPAEFQVTGSPVTGAGTLAVTSVPESANTVWAGPASGSPAPPRFRPLVAADMGATVAPFGQVPYSNGAGGFLFDSHFTFTPPSSPAVIDIPYTVMTGHLGVGTQARVDNPSPIPSLSVDVFTATILLADIVDGATGDPPTTIATSVASHIDYNLTQNVTYPYFVHDTRLVSRDGNPYSQNTVVLHHLQFTNYAAGSFGSVIGALINLEMASTYATSGIDALTGLQILLGSQTGSFFQEAFGINIDLFYANSDTFGTPTYTELNLAGARAVVPGALYDFIGIKLGDHTQATTGATRLSQAVSSAGGTFDLSAGPQYGDPILRLRQPSGGPVDTTAMMVQLTDSGGTVLGGYQYNWQLRPATLDDATTAGNEGVYYSSTQGFLAYRDSGGTIHSLYGSSLAIGSAIGGGTPGSVLFVDGSGDLGQDNAQLFYNPTGPQLGLGTNLLDGSAALQIDSTVRGLLPPRMAAAQRFSIGSPAEGLIVYDTDIHVPYFWNGSSWMSMQEGVSSVAATAPAEGFTISGSPITSSGTFTFTLANDLAAVEALSTTGLATRTASETWATRTLTGTSNVISVTNGDGVSGDPTITISASYVGQTSITTLGTITTGVWNGTTVDVPHGGTNKTSFTAYAVICGGTTSTGALQSVASVGTSGQVLTSNGAGALPTFQTVSAGVSSVANSDGTLTISPTTGAVVASINLAHANTWTAIQTFTASPTSNFGSGSQNERWGDSAGASGASGSENAAFGYSALTSLTSGSNNVTVGGRAGKNITTSSDNVLIGRLAGFSLTTSSGNNVALGSLALFTADTASQNLAIGGQSLQNCTSGSSNVAIGVQALVLLTTGGQNVALGQASGSGVTSGSGNVFIGMNTGGTLTSGSENTLIGDNANVSSSGANYAIALGQDALAADSELAISPRIQNSRWYIYSSTAAKRATSDLVQTAVDNTDGSRKYRVTCNVWDTAAREAWRAEASGSVVKLGFYGATAVVQPAGTGETSGFTAGAGTAVKDDSTFTGNVGATAYRISDIVKALKNLGLLAQ